jgi:hypothetical protein
MFHLPLSVVAHDGLHDLQEKIHTININDGIMNAIYWRGGSYFYTRKVYGVIIGQHDTPRPFMSISKEFNLPRKHIFVGYYFDED